ncbi:type III secretion system cytoplasmic ring protein SctQ [Parendozoicomonas haliclonae]|uniref:Type III secretion system protein n=1 Tax=Parendozoicomonas haliclonae TaxID=1960125 RepID=A0A1X7AHW4_9GAMM|nr:type III secretion system cytoplasmic ring protein SctQ [Parendozoicomonas haliclonae]SMA42382.1 type III secretion system protein [Parendozoicomonas haliclonae]
MSPQAANIQPLALQTLSHQQASINNLACGTHLQLQSQIHGQPWQISLSAFSPTGPLDFELQLSVDGLPARVQVSRDLFREVEIGNTPLPDLLDQLPDDLRLGCLNIALERLLSDLRAAVQRDIRLQRISRCEHIVEGTPCLSLQFQGNGQSSQGILVVNDQLHGQLQGAISTAMPRVADDIAMPLAVEIGHTVIADQRLRQLASGDIVLMDRCWYRDKKSILLRLSAHSGYVGSLEDSRVTLKQLVKTGLESGMSDDFDDFDDLDDDLDLGDDFDDDDDLDFDEPTAAAPEPAAPAMETHQQAPEASAPAPAAAPQQQVDHKDVQGLPVKLAFDVGHHELTVGDMGHLGPGYTFELNRDLTSPVTMKANGKPFAVCELVSINNQLGARIVKLL